MRNSKLDIVITMGGLGSRFREAGYTVPKYMIEVRGKTLFEWSMESLKGYRSSAAQYIFIAMRDEEADVEGFLRSKCEQLDLPDCHIILLDYLTDGQATTAALAKEYWVPDHGLLIYNIDTYVEPGNMTAQELRGDGFIPCFRGSGDHWSFVRLDETGKAVEIKEKVRISDHCTLGAYYFSSCRLYQTLYDEYYGEGYDIKAKGEKYVAPLYDHLISKGGDIYISEVDPAKVHVLGTPEELDQFANEKTSDGKY